MIGGAGLAIRRSITAITAGVPTAGAAAGAAVEGTALTR